MNVQLSMEVVLIHVITLLDHIFVSVTLATFLTATLTVAVVRIM